MSHAIDTTDGKSSFVSANESAWHMLGQTLDHSFTAEEAMTEGLLGNWNVRKAPMFAEVGGTRLAVPGMNAVVRDNPVRAGQVDILSTYGVSDAYQIVQNEEHAAFLNALVDESGAHFDTAGSIHGGRQVFITMKLPGHINIGGVDPVENYIAAVNSHDGSMAFTLMVTPVRIVCANTLNCAFQNNSHIIRTRHTSGIRENLVVKARKALDVSFNYLDAFQEEAERLINTVMTQTQFEAIIEKEFGPAEDAPAATYTRAMNKVSEIQELFADAQTQDGIRDTAWAGFNALTEWADHKSPSRGDDRDTSRAIRSIMDPGFKTRALNLMLAHA